MRTTALEDPAHEPFIVKEADVDLFQSDDTIDVFMVPRPISQLDSLQDSLTIQTVHFAPPTLPRRSRRLSMASTSSSNSSLCSRSINFGDDESYVSHGDQSEASNRSERRRGRMRFSSKRRKRRVKFHSRIKIRSIPNLRNLSDETISAVWYCEHELEEIKANATESVRMAKNHELPEECTLRGIYIPKRQQRKSLWNTALACVLDEQKRQAEQNSSDPDKIAELYHTFAQKAQKIALKIAQGDARAAWCD